MKLSIIDFGFIGLLFWIASAGTSVSQENRSWISPLFSSSPNVNLGGERFSPYVLDLDSMLEQSKGDSIRICFDNGPLYARSFNQDQKLEFEKKFCLFDQRPMSNLGLVLNKQIRTGLVIRHSKESNVYTCDAKFNLTSLAAALRHFNEYGTGQTAMETLNFDQPGSGIVPENHIQSFLDPRDKLAASWTSAGRFQYVEISMNYTWQCLLPSFRYYWSIVAETCLNSTPSKDLWKSNTQIFFPILEKEKDKLLALSRNCFR